MDFIVELPEVKGYNQILVVVDRFSKMAHFIALKKGTVNELTAVFMKEIWRLHGLPKTIVIYIIHTESLSPYCIEPQARPSRLKPRRIYCHKQ